MKWILLGIPMMLLCYSAPSFERTVHAADPINHFLEIERYNACKRYAEAVYADLVNGMNMTHPEAEGKEKTALEFMKDAFIDCFKPYRAT